MKQTMMDKCIRANVRLAENEIAITLTMTLAIGLCFLNLFIVLFAVVPLVVSTVYLFKTYQKIFYTSVYGHLATTYQSLPATAAEMTAAKIFVAGLTNLLSTVFALAIIVAVFTGSGWLGPRMIVDILRDLKSVGVTDVSYFLPAEFLNMVILCFWQATLIFMVIVVYKSVKIRGHKIPAVLAIAGGFAINYVFSNCTSLLTALGLEYSFVHPAFSIAVQIVTMIIMFRITVKLLEEKYEA